jgi:hypothetical protein
MVDSHGYKPHICLLFSGISQGRIKVRIQTGYMILALAMLASCATPGTTPHVTNTVLTKTADLVTARRVPTRVFSTEDSVVCYVYFQWDDVTKEAGHHQVEWRWYQDDKLVSQSKKQLNFKRTPYTTWTARSAGSLGVGHFSVATVVDGQVASTSSFEIKP